MQNPYWINYRNLRENKKDRFMLNASLSYDILDWLSLSGRVRMDQSFTTYTENSTRLPSISLQKARRTVCTASASQRIVRYMQMPFSI